MGEAFIKRRYPPTLVERAYIRARALNIVELIYPKEESKREN